MALTADQAALVRYYMGYSVAGDAQYFVFRELAYTNRSWASISLDDPAGGGRLAHLSVVEEARITVTDPVSGISFEIAEYKQFRQTSYHVALAWGAANIKPNHVAVLAG